MSITDELRKWGYGFCGSSYEIVNAIADRIDAEHEKAMSRAGQLLDDAEKERDCNYANWQDCKQKVLQHNITLNELETEIERLKDELLHCIELPKDADGVSWNPDDRDEDGNEVVELWLTSDGWWLCAGGICRRPDRCRHYHEPTVDDLLFSYGQACIRASNEAETDASKQTMLANLREEYAAKLRLADDGKEQ